MATKIRLQRFGKKGKPFYHVVVADSRAPRDGKFIERLGSYNPNTNPATIELNFDSALNWLNQGAQPTDTAKAILSYKGVLYKKHLLGGVKKGAFDEATAETRFNEWLEKKGGQIDSKKESLNKSQQEAKQAALAAEAKKKADMAAAIAAKNAPEAPEVEEAPEPEAVVEETPVVEAAVEETPVAEEAPAVEAVVEEAPVAEEAPAVEEPVAEAPVAEEPVAEAPAEETPSAETAEDTPSAAEEK